MNQIFSFKRWWLLVGKHWSENRKRYTLSVLAFAGLIALWFVFMLVINNSDPLPVGMQQGFYLTGIFVIAPFYASQFYRELGSTPKGINYLLTPASTLEKLLTGIFYSVIGFFLVYTAIFYIVDTIFVLGANTFSSYYNTAGPDGRIHKAVVTNIFAIGGHEEFNISYYFFLTYIAVQSYCLLGSVYFPKYSYIKLAITLCLLCLAVFFVEMAFVRTITHTGGGLESSLTSFRVYKGGTPEEVSLAPWIATSVKALFQFGFPVVFWLATYFRLKEKQI